MNNTLPEHLFISSCDGALYDTRRDNWSAEPIRHNYCMHHSEIRGTKDLRASIREGSHTSIGGYPIAFVTSDGGTLSHSAVVDNYRIISESVRSGSNSGWRITHLMNCADCDEPVFCDHSGELIHSYE